jgi:hypothetical protein
MTEHLGVKSAHCLAQGCEKMCARKHIFVLE